VHSCCYATIPRRNIKFLGNAGKHAKNTGAVARQLLDQQFQAGNEHARNNRETVVSIQRRGKHVSKVIEVLLESVFFSVRAKWL
jgi:hypothetical protein